jgi:NADH-quinone oxidoreductase subunit M
MDGSITNTLPHLSLLIWLPIFGAIGVLCLGEARAVWAKRLGLVVSLLTLLLGLQLWRLFVPAGGMQFLERSAWIPSFHIDYALGIDGIALPLIVLTAIITPLVLISAWTVIEKKVAQYVAAFLILEGLMIGVFAAMDAMLFYVFFEAMLIPMFIIIGVWGGPNRVYATIKFFLYTFLGSIFMLLALLYLYQKTGSFSFEAWYDPNFHLTAREQFWIFCAFFAAFAVKIPMFPVHTWLPDAHVEAPTGGSIILAAIMLKIGGYGFLRFSLPIVPDASADLAHVVILLSLIAVVYIGLVALAQEDMKKLVAYSSISHMGFVTLGIFIVMQLIREQHNADTAALAMQGAMVQMISHGFISAAMFGAIGVMYDRVHSRAIKDYGGVINKMPWFGGFAVLFAMANCGLPATSGFVGEFMVILAAFAAKPLLAAIAALTLVIGAAYTLWMVKRVFFGAVGNDHVEHMSDLNSREWIVMTTLAFFVLLLGVYPKLLTDVMQPSISALLQQISISRL